ncbi:CCA tRNA nucleotidyltransferase [Paenibacillus dendritiformis]|uniref:CCA tRNA nucleotidyltransferase n=1 Tax=Paenibacillus dendritiformis TaxID=130049 RepID=UPI003657A0F9
MKCHPEEELLYAEAEQVMRHLLDAGHEAYIVGGSVRDRLLGRPIGDIDIATSALPEQVTALFRRVVPTGLAHGTVTVVMDHYTYEVTTFRKESAYEDHRRPEEVEFIDDLEEDLRRRDFTINAMALDIEGRLRDPFGGRDDLERRLIRCVGDPETRFREDALRMLRGVRFASLLGGRIAKSTWRALIRQRETLGYVAMERVRDELWKLTAGADPARGWAMLARSGLLRYAKEPLGALAGPAPDGWPRLLCALGSVAGPELRFAALLLGLAAGEAEAKRIVQALRFSGAQQDAVLGVLRAEARLAAGGEAALAGPGGERAWRRAYAEALYACGEDALRGWHACRRALAGVPEERLAPFLRDGEAWLQRITVRRLPDIALTGGDLLQAAARPAGPWLREALEAAWLAVALGDVPNERDKLRKYVEKEWKRE